MLDSFPELPNLKKLTLLVKEADNWLLHLASIVNACPNLHTFAIKVLMLCPIHDSFNLKYIHVSSYLILNLFSSLRIEKYIYFLIIFQNTNNLIGVMDLRG